MSAMATILAAARNLLPERKAEGELAREVSAHLTLLEDDFRRRGLSADDARLAAHRAFGGVEQAKERQRDARSFVWLVDAQRDMYHASRLLRRDPLFTATAVLSLAIGIGANTTIFTVGNALLFRAPDGVADPDALIDIGTRTPGGGFGNSSYPNYLDLRRRATTLDGVYASGLFPRAMSLSGAGDSVCDRTSVRHAGDRQLLRRARHDTRCRPPVRRGRRGSTGRSTRWSC